MTKRPHHLKNRRAGLLVAALIVLAWVNLAIVSAVTAGADDSVTSQWRVDALRARVNAHSAARIALRLQKNDPEAPFSGVITLPGGATVEIADPFAPQPQLPGELVAQAIVGEAMERARLELTRQPAGAPVP